MGLAHPDDGSCPAGRRAEDKPGQRPVIAEPGLANFVNALVPQPKRKGCGTLGMGCAKAKNRWGE